MGQAPEMPVKIEGVVDRIEGNTVIIQLPQHNQVTLPKQLLHETITEGDSVVISVESKHHATQERQKIARDILNELLISKTP